MFLLQERDEDAERIRQERLKAYEAKQAKSKFVFVFVLEILNSVAV